MASETKALLTLLFAYSTLAHQYSKIRYSCDIHDKKIEETYVQFVSSKIHDKREASAAPNETIIIRDDHRYYNSSYHPAVEADKYWLELNDLLEVEEDNLTPASEEEDLQGLHRFYKVSLLKFSFPFFGHFIDEVAITTGGFLYTGSFYHDQIHLSQIIAPLQADFNPSLNESARILVYSTTDRYTVQWDMVHNHDHVEAGPFTFQVSLFPNGTIYFVYKEIPLPISDIDNSDHPVEVGLADAFYYDVPREREGIMRYIIEYSRIKLNSTDDLVDSAYVITPNKNCVVGGNCEECQEITSQGRFECAWCPAIMRCADVNGYDRHTQEWYDSGCVQNGTTTCPVPSTTAASIVSRTVSSYDSSTAATSRSTSVASDTVTTLRMSTTIHVATPVLAVTPRALLARTSTVIGVVVGVVVIILLAAVVGVVVAILVYGYRRPTSHIGMAMIQNRPGAWKLNKQEVAYSKKGEKILLD